MTGTQTFNEVIKDAMDQFDDAVVMDGGSDTNIFDVWNELDYGREPEVAVVDHILTGEDGQTANAWRVYLMREDGFMEQGEPYATIVSAEDYIWLGYDA